MFRMKFVSFIKFKGYFLIYDLVFNFGTGNRLVTMSLFDLRTRNIDF